MKKFHVFMLLAVAALLSFGMASCSEKSNDENEFPNWKETNDNYFENKYTEVKKLVNEGSTNWKVLRSWSLNEDVATHSYDYVLANVLTAGTGSGCPLYTDSVKVHYQGRLLPTVNYPQGKIFDQSWQGDFNPDVAKPSTFAVNGVVNGFSTALQHMHIGDRWQVIIPYQLAYDSSDTPGAAYSTLIFDVTLVGYFRRSVSEMPALNPAEANSKVKGEWIYE